MAERTQATGTRAGGGRELDDLLSRARCVVWEAEVREARGRLTWRLAVRNEEAARRLLPLRLSPGKSYSAAWRQARPPEDRRRGEEIARRALSSGAPGYSHDFRCRLADGKERWIREEVDAEPRGPRHWHLVGICTDVTDPRRAEESLREREEQFRLISENMEDLVAVVDVQGRRLYNSPSYRKVLGDPEALHGTNSFAEIHPEDRERIQALFQETVRSGVGRRAEYRFQLPDGSIRYIESLGSVIHDSAGQPARVVVVARDITERKLLEAELLQAQKLEAIGRLAAGVAHDFNNLLAVIGGYTDVLIYRLGPEHSAARHLEEVRSATRKAAALTRQLLAFSRKQMVTPQVLNLNEVLANLEKMLKRLIGEDVDLVLMPARGLPRVSADPGQIEQVIMNLVVNARDAMPQGGKLILGTERVRFDGERARRFGGRPGDYVMLSISDTGCGMDAETLEHIFEPFFTTKGVDQGTGLGLATVFGTVKQSEGEIEVESEPGQGATFKIYLPAVEAEPEARLPEAEVAVPAAGGSETILLVEDDETLRNLLRQLLEMRGYRVLEAREAGDATVICNRHAGTIHLLLTDVVMPGLSGRELSERLGPMRPEMKVLYMSGYTDDAVIHHGVRRGDTHFLEKPFGPRELARKVREVLDEPGER